MVSMQCLRTRMQALRQVRADIICRSRRNIRPSSEILQIVPDLFEIFSETQPHRASQRRHKKLHWTLLPHSLNFCSRPQCGKRATISASYCTNVQTLPEAIKAEMNSPSRSEEASVVNLCRESKLHVKHKGVTCRCSTTNPFNVRLSLEESVANLQSNPDIPSRHRMDQVHCLVVEIQQRKLRGKPIPESINPLDLDHLLNLLSQSGRKKFLNFLVKKEKSKHKRAEGQASRLKLKANTSASQEPELTVCNTIVRRGQSVAEDASNAWNLAKSLIFGPPIVFDLSYDAHMDRREVVNTIMQLNLVLKINKTLQDPFHIHFTSVAQDGHAEQELKRVHSGRYNHLLVSITDKHPQHIFLNDQLVYLTADSLNVLPNYDPSKIYIIGGFVDRRVKSRISLRKAEEAGIPHARLPLDEHLRWHKSTKNLTLDQMMCILSELKASGDWSRALQHVPSRKHLGSKVLL